LRRVRALPIMAPCYRRRAGRSRHSRRPSRWSWRWSRAPRRRAALAAPATAVRRALAGCHLAFGAAPGQRRCGAARASARACSGRPAAAIRAGRGSYPGSAGPTTRRACWGSCATRSCAVAAAAVAVPPGALPGAHPGALGVPALRRWPSRLHRHGVRADGDARRPGRAAGARTAASGPRRPRVSGVPRHHHRTVERPTAIIDGVEDEEGDGNTKGQRAQDATGMSLSPRWRLLTRSGPLRVG
jgi:hypothetical protein